MFDTHQQFQSDSERRVSHYSQQLMNSLKDSISSLTYRISQVESSLSRKIDRSECLAIVEKKVGLGQLKRYLDELQTRFKEDQRLEEERSSKMQEMAIEKITELSKKLKTINSNRQKQDNKTNKSKQRNNQPQQLFLESNQTMFSMLIDQISRLQQKDDDFQKQLESRNKKMISLNNQVFRKLQKLQSEIQQKQASTYQRIKISQPMIGSSWSQIEKSNKATVHKGFSNGSAFESVRLQLLSKNIEALQKDILKKLDIKDVLPIIKQNTQSISHSIEDLKEYVEESMESTRKILTSQTEINREMSLGMRIGWWHSYSQENQIAILNKELLNLIPQVFQCHLDQPSISNYINVLQQGIYLIKIIALVNHALSIDPLDDNENETRLSSNEFQVMIGTQVYILAHQSTLRLEKNTEIRVILRNHTEILIFLQKL